MEYNIIEYQEKYKEKVINFWVEICIQEFDLKHWKKDIEKFDNHLYQKDGGNFWIARNGKDEVVGTIALRNLGKGNVLLKSLYVKKQCRNNGIAKELFNIAIKFAKENDYRKILLETYEIFESAIKFYQKNEFVIKHHIGKQYLMEKDL